MLVGSGAGCSRLARSIANFAPISAAAYCLRIQVAMWSNSIAINCGAMTAKWLTEATSLECVNLLAYATQPEPGMLRLTHIAMIRLMATKAVEKKAPHEHVPAPWSWSKSALHRCEQLCTQQLRSDADDT